MREFEIEEYLEDDIFNELIDRIIMNVDSSKVIPLIDELDSYISEKAGIVKAKIEFTGMREGCEGHFDNDFSMQISDSYLSCSNNLTLLEIYLHEKRHQFQYECFLQKNDLVDQVILDEYDDLIYPKDVCVISGKRSFNQLYGYYGMEMEQDAYRFAYNQILTLLAKKGYLWSDEERPAIINKFIRKIKSFDDDEFAHWIDVHKKKFEARKLVEEEILKRFKEAIRTGAWEKDLKKIVFSRRLYKCLNEEEKASLYSFFEQAKDSQINSSEKFLDKLIDREIEKNMKQKRSQLGVI